MSSVMVRNVPLPTLLQAGLAAPHPSFQEGSSMAQLPSPFYRSTGIHALPVELLTRIFVLGSSLDDPYVESPFLLKPDQEYRPIAFSNFQVTVSHVCHHWRQVSLRTQSLWTTLHFREASHIARARTYIARCSLSNTYPLDILVDTVSAEEHVPGITLYKDEIRRIFQLITPLVKRWRAFHLKICDNQCKAVAREFLSSCGPGPCLETLQLYHFEDYRTSDRLWQATYRPPVVVFNNTLPSLKNLSLIGVNLPWARSPYLVNLHHLELALHPDNIRPPYEWWEKMLRLSPELQKLYLHYSGPKLASNDPLLSWPRPECKVPLERLEELSLVDLDPDYLCDMMKRIFIPNLVKLNLNLPDQDFTPFLQLISSDEFLGDEAGAGSAPSPGFSNESASAPPSPQTTPLSPPFQSTLAKLRTLRVLGLECDYASWPLFLRHIHRLETLEIDFSRVSAMVWEVMMDGLGVDPTESDTTLLPSLTTFKVSGISGKKLLSGIRYRHGLYVNRRAARIKWIVGWSERFKGHDTDLDSLVMTGVWVGNGSTRIKVSVNIFDLEELREGDDETEVNTDDQREEEESDLEETSP